MRTLGLLKPIVLKNGDQTEEEEEEEEEEKKKVRQGNRKQRRRESNPIFALKIWGTLFVSIIIFIMRLHFRIPFLWYACLIIKAT